MAADSSTVYKIFRREQINLHLLDITAVAVVVAVAAADAAALDVLENISQKIILIPFELFCWFNSNP